MTDRQIQLVETSWDYVIMNSKEAGRLFYDRLFTVEPSLRSLFRGDISAQANKLVSMVTFVVHKLNSISEVVKDVKALGERHANYKVKPEHYKIVGETLLWTLEQGMGSEWTQEHKDAWVAVYSVLSLTMMSGASKVSA